MNVKRKKMTTANPNNLWLSVDNEVNSGKSVEERWLVAVANGRKLSGTGVAGGRC